MFLNLIVGFVIVGITVIIQGFGTMYWVSVYRDKIKHLEGPDYGKRGATLLIRSSLFLILLHLVQASLWALLFLVLPGIPEIETFEKSIYFSLVTFTTLGYGEITIGSVNRILAGLEAINGITLIGWSTALMFAMFQEVLKARLKRGQTS